MSSKSFAPRQVVEFYNKNPPVTMETPLNISEIMWKGGEEQKRKRLSELEALSAKWADSKFRWVLNFLGHETRYRVGLNGIINYVYDEDVCKEPRPNMQEVKRALGFGDLKPAVLDGYLATMKDLADGITMYYKNDGDDDDSGMADAQSALDHKNVPSVPPLENPSCSTVTDASVAAALAAADASARAAPDYGDMFASFAASPATAASRGQAPTASSAPAARADVPKAKPEKQNDRPAVAAPVAAAAATGAAKFNEMDYLTGLLATVELRSDERTKHAVNERSAKASGDTAAAVQHSVAKQVSGAQLKSAKETVKNRMAGMRCMFTNALCDRPVNMGPCLRVRVLENMSKHALQAQRREATVTIWMVPRPDKPAFPVILLDDAKMILNAANLTKSAQQKLKIEDHPKSIGHIMVNGNELHVIAANDPLLWGQTHNAAMAMNYADQITGICMKYAANASSGGGAAGASGASSSSTSSSFSRY